MDFVLLADFPEALHQVARWYFDEWAAYSGASSAESIAAKLEAYFNRESIPLIVLAVERSQILGAAQLKYREMSRYPEKEHWLGGVYVAREHRGRGVASQMVERVVEIATSLGVSLLHLQTERLDGGLYVKLGWQPWKQVNDHGRDVLIMERSLG